MRVTLFTGHRIDASDRQQVRFPASQAIDAGKVIEARLSADHAVCSAANGGDILFLEACQKKCIPFDIVLPFAPADFVERSVASEAAGNWIQRFYAIWQATPKAHQHILPPSAPSNPYVACNKFMLELALQLGPPCQLIALWNVQRSKKPGGTEDMVLRAKNIGFEIDIINPLSLRKV